MSKNVKSILIGFFITVSFTLGVIGLVIFKEWQNNELTVYFFDVGQGDGALIRTPERFDILIDGGPDNTLVYKLGQYLPFYDREIDLVIITHPDSDHLTGFAEVFKRYHVRFVLLTGMHDDLPAYQEILKNIKPETNVIFSDEIATIAVGSEASLTIFYPRQRLAGETAAHNNDYSIVAKLVYGQTSFLFTGDIPAKIEQQLVGQELDLRADVLKVSHHGSRSSSASSFLQAVRPFFAVIQVGENRFGHPHPSVVARLKAFGIKVLITKEAGDIVFFSNGRQLQWQAESLHSY